MKPFLKWAGGKGQLLPELVRRLPSDFEDLHYYEPFVGGGALLFDREPVRVTINDLNGELMMTYRVVQYAPKELVERLREHQDKHCGDYYYEIRNLDRQMWWRRYMSDVDLAARLIYLNKTCYNGLYRVNSMGQFNVPLGSKTFRFDDRALFDASDYLRWAKVDIRTGDYKFIGRGCGKGDFFYLDPPYPGGFTDYQPGGFDEDAHTGLADKLHALTRRGAKCMLSCADTPSIRGLYENRGYRVESVTARRNINSKASGRGPVGEVIIMNYPEGS